VITSGVGSSA